MFNSTTLFLYGTCKYCQNVKEIMPMGFLKKHFSMYSHLPKEIYVLAFGKVMTSMGALIWPMLTLIKSEK